MKAHSFSRFKELPLGALFHRGKHYGMGFNSKVLIWQVFVKDTPKSGRVVEVHGLPLRGLEVGNRITPYWSDPVWTHNPETPNDPAL